MIMNLQQFAASRGLVTDAEVQGHLHAGLRSAPQTKTFKRFFDRKLLELQQARDETRRLYEEAIALGEIQRPEPLSLAEKAQGHPDNPATQAALRVLAKRAGRVLTSQPEGC